MTTETDGQEAAPEATAAPAEEASAQVDETSEATAEADGDDAPDGDESTAEAPPKAKGVQKRLDELTRRYREAERREERLLALLERQTAPQAHPAQPEGPPREDQFESYEDYEQARIDYAVEQRLRQAREEEQRTTVYRTYEERAAKLRETATDYDTVVNDPTLKITPLMADVIRESDVGPQVAYHLGTNRSEAERIASLPPHRQAAELGRLEARLTPVTQAPPPKRNPPPAPPQTVAGISNGLNKAPEDMTMAEYVAARNAGQI